MGKRLEDFIYDNRKQLDVYDAPEGIWDKIESRLDEADKIARKPAKVVQLKLVIRIAASFVLIAAAGLAFWVYSNKQSPDISAISPQLAEQQYHYSSVIEEKRNELKQIEKLDPALYKEFSKEIRAIDENYKKLKKDLATSPNQEETVKAMVKNLQIQIQLLNQQLQIIEQVNELKKPQANEIQSI
jgi:hypothetical protein